jgi:hypothetical protein
MLASLLRREAKGLSMMGNAVPYYGAIWPKLVETEQLSAVPPSGSKSCLLSAHHLQERTDH